MRRLLFSLSVVCTCFLPLHPVQRQLAAANCSTNKTAQQMIAAAVAFQNSLTADEAQKANMKFDDPARVDWHNIPKPARKGLELRTMSSRSREACMQLLQAGLSDSGFEEALRIMSLENNLREGEKGIIGGAIRDPQRYYLTIFGTPATTGKWGWSFEGHHLSLNFVVGDGCVRAATPCFWGANPATVRVYVPDGPAVGTRSLAEEEQLAFDLLTALDAAQRLRAVIATAAPADYRAAGEPRPPQDPPAGIPAQALDENQKSLLQRVVLAYAENWEADVRDEQLHAISASGWDRVHFAWLGASEPGKGHAFRIQGPTFVLEFVNVQTDPAGNPANHVHSVWRNPAGDFGMEL